MKRYASTSFFLLLIILVAASCNTISNLPTNTTGGLFSLNGTWQLAASTNDDALKGTTITVYPVIGNGTVKSVQNNTYCIKEGTELWRNIKSNDKGFKMNNLVSNCNGTTIIKEAEITVINNDEVTVTTRNASGSEMIQQWKRVTNQ